MTLRKTVRRLKVDNGGDAPIRYDIVMVAPHLGPGGSQRVVSLLANNWAREGWRICVVTIFGQPDDNYALSSDILRIKLEEFRNKRLLRLHGKGWFGRLRKAWPGRLPKVNSLLVVPIRKAIALVVVIERLVFRKLRLVFRKLRAKIPVLRANDWRTRELRRILREYDSSVVLSFLGATNIRTILATQNLNRFVVISERNDPARQTLDPPWDELRRSHYNKADVVTANSHGAITAMVDFVPGEKLRYVPNPLDLPPLPEPRPPSRNNFLTVARLVHQKGIDVLLRAFALVADEVGDWTLEIVGDGPMRSELGELAEDLGIFDRVIFHGHQDSPLGFYLQARIFVLPSRFEGMPNALLEAMGCGLASIVTDASPGPLEFVTHGESGLVVDVDDPPALAKAMLSMARDDALRGRLASEARRRINELSWAHVNETWKDILRLPPLQSTELIVGNQAEEAPQSILSSGSQMI